MSKDQPSGNSQRPEEPGAIESQAPTGAEAESPKKGGFLAFTRPKATVVGLIVLTATLGVFVNAFWEGRIPGRDYGPSVEVVSAPLVVSRFAYLDPMLVIPRPPSEIPRGPADEEGPEARQEWADGLGAVDANFSLLSVIPVAPSGRSLILTGVTVDVVECQAPLSGTFVPWRYAGDLGTREVIIDIDADPPRVELAGIEAWDFPLEISSTDQEVFELIGRVAENDCTWHPIIHYVDRGKQGSLRASNGDEPFRTTSSQNAERCALDTDGAIVCDGSDPSAAGT